MDKCFQPVSPSVVDFPFFEDRNLGDMDVLQEMWLAVDPTQDPEPCQMTPKCVPSVGIDVRLARLRWDEANVASPGGNKPSSISFSASSSKAPGRVWYIGDILGSVTHNAKPCSVRTA